MMFRKRLYRRILRLERERFMLSNRLRYQYVEGYDRLLYVKRFNEICRDMQIILTNNREVFDATRSAVKEMFVRKRGGASDRYETGDWYLKHAFEDDALRHKCRAQFSQLADIPF